MSPSASADEAIEFETAAFTRVPDGQYAAVLVYHETSFIYRTPKVYFWFRIVDPGDYFGVMLYRAYRVKLIRGKPKRNGGFTVGKRSDLLKDLVRLLNIRSRPDRISAKELRSRAWRIRTRTVNTDYAQCRLPEWLRYSVVDTIVCSETS